jgi:serine acetyltransferase
MAFVACKRQRGNFMSAWSTFVASVRADHDALHDFANRYNGDRGAKGSIATDLVRRVGFQMLVAVRLMQLGRDLRIPLFGPLMSRLIRHFYAAEIHWEAQIAPGIAIVHGNGLVISRSAIVGAGCLLFQGVTLGESMDPDTGIQGAPTLGRHVHVMPNAVLVGPITVGEGTKVQANVTLATSVPDRTSVRAAKPEFVLRTATPQRDCPREDAQ